ncbi:Rho GTPase-activating protein 26-like protein [Dinothrombium tinctorium]|uniref:Rho GTPase-activating protein 26-like protein n=1 Tax=Dinothrombium tinctorium TaxID=1965070 RepID=A0A3S3SFY1_9ACAR|nr:Rho GTPase-activating protein 26-like protein [Dinothrombium tinctorium]
MGLLPIEFTDCLTDSPYFRENLHAHERELDTTSIQIKGLIREVKELLNAAKTLSRAQRNLADTLSKFEFQCIGGSQTDDEIVIAGALKEFGRLLSTIEDERERMLERAASSFIEPIEKFRRDQIFGAKEQKKKFDKETAKFCQSLERHLNLSTKKSETHLQEADASLVMEQRHFYQASLEYVHKLQEVQERKKFEFVETILTFMYGWLTFYHQGHEVAKEFKSFMIDLQIRLQRTRENYNATHDETENLMRKMLEIRKTVLNYKFLLTELFVNLYFLIFYLYVFLLDRMLFDLNFKFALIFGMKKPQDPGTLNKMYSRQGYLFLMEKKAFGTTWVKTFCQYQKEYRRFTMIPYNQTVGKITTTETITLKECVRRMSDSIDKRFCFDIVAADKPVTFTFQALSEEDRKLWVDAMDGKDPIQLQSSSSNVNAKSLINTRHEECLLDDLGFAFVRKCIDIIETRGLEDQGLYRVGGVSSKVSRLIQTAFDRKKHSNEGEIVFEFDNPDEWEIRTITSALKFYFRNLPEPLLTYRLHNAFIAAAKQENRVKRVDDIHSLIHQLPKLNFDMLHLLIQHLKKVAQNAEKNLMPVNNLGVCLGPSLLRPEEESVAAIMDTKFANVVVEILIENCDKIFNTTPNDTANKRSAADSSLQPQQISPITASNTYDPQGTQIMNQSGYTSRGPITYTESTSTNNLNTYATVPVRGSHNQVYRSSSQNQLAQAQQQQTQHQHIQFRNRPTYQQTMSYQQPPISGMQYSSQPLPMYPMHLSEPVTPRQGFRPIAVYNPWNSQSNLTALQMTENHSESKSPVNSAGESLPNHQHQQQSSPRTSPSLTNQCGSTVFYSYNSNNTRQPQSQQSSVSNTSASNAASSSISNLSTSSKGPGRKVRTLYACVGENESELSFEPNVVICNVRQSKEQGWLEGYYNGKVGLIPQNYVQFID